VTGRPPSVFLIRSTVETLFAGSLAWWSKEFGWTAQDSATVYLADEQATTQPPDTAEWIEFTPAAVEPTREGVVAT
jgi:hypothetical protein